MTLKNYILFLSSCIPVSIALAQSSDPDTGPTSDRQGVVISTESSDYPEQSAILHIKNQAGEKAGVKFPELQFSPALTDRDNDGDVDIKDLADYMDDVIRAPQNGLLYYNPSGSLQGFYYFDESAGTQWLKLASGNEKNIGIPDGTVIQYAGDLNLFTESGIGKRGTPAEGWYICNGRNNTPDLTASFLKGFNGNIAADNIGSENSQSDDYFTITSEHMPQHTHDVRNFKLEGGHDHKVIIAPHRQEHTIYSRNSPKVPAKDYDHGNHTIAYRYSYEKNTYKRELNPAPLGMQNPAESGEPLDMKASLVRNEDVLSGKWLEEPKGQVTYAMDNRPAFFVVVYIMKIEKPAQARNYTK